MKKVILILCFLFLLAPEINGQWLGVVGSKKFASGPVTISLATSSGSSPYTTSFPATENPVSQGGIWVNGLATGLDWTNVRTTANTEAYGTQTGSPPGTLNDSIAVITNRAYNNNQYAKGTVYCTGSDSIDEEIELHLQGAITAHNIYTYELDCQVFPAGSYGCSINKWLGSMGSYTREVATQSVNNSGTCQPGDILKATIVNGIITIYNNNIQCPSLQWTDSSPYTGGTPGMGMFVETTGGTNSNYGFSHWEGGDQVENVNGSYSAPVFNGGATSLPVSTVINVTSGNTIIMPAASYQHTPAVADVSKTAGTATIGTIYRDVYTAGTSGTVGLAVLRASVTGSGSLTMTFNPGITNIAFGVAEYSGIASGPVGATDTDTGTGTAQTTHGISNTSGSVIIYIASELSTGSHLRAFSDNMLINSNDGTGFTFGAQYKITTATPTTMTSTWPESVQWWTCAVEYKAASN